MVLLKNSIKLKSVEQAHLAALGQIAQGAEGFQLLDVGSAHLGAGVGDIVHGDELTSALPALLQVLRRRVAQAGDGHKGLAQLAVLDEEVGGIGLVNVDVQEGEAAEIEFVDGLQGSEQILILGAGVRVVLDLPDLSERH